MKKTFIILVLASFNGIAKEKEEPRLIDCPSSFSTKYTTTLGKGIDTKTLPSALDFPYSANEIIKNFKLVSSSIAKIGRYVNCVYKSEGKYSYKRTLMTRLCKTVKKIETKDHSYYCY